MSFLSTVGSFFKKVGVLVAKATGLAVAAGVTDDIVRLALSWVRVASTKYTDNAERREYVVSILMLKGIPESIARFAVELAVRLFKAELKQLEDKTK